MIFGLSKNLKMILIGLRANYYDKTIRRANDETDWDIIMSRDNSLYNYNDFSSLYSLYLPSLHKTHCFVLIKEDISFNNKQSCKLRFIFSKSSRDDISLDYKHSSSNYSSSSDSLYFYHFHYIIDNYIISLVSDSISIFPLIYSSILNKLILLFT